MKKRGRGLVLLWVVAGRQKSSDRCGWRCDTARWEDGKRLGYQGQRGGRGGGYRIGTATWCFLICVLRGMTGTCQGFGGEDEAAWLPQTTQLA